MNDKKFWSLKLLKLKYRRGDQIILPKKLAPPVLNLWKFRESGKGTPD